MLQETLMELVQADDPKIKEKLYRRLEKVGMDRMTAKILAKELRKEMGVHEPNE